MPCEPKGCLVTDTIILLEKKAAQKRGNLYIKFNITFPKRIMTEHRDIMVHALETNTVSS